MPAMTAMVRNRADRRAWRDDVPGREMMLVSTRPLVVPRMPLIVRAVVQVFVPPVILDIETAVLVDGGARMMTAVDPAAANVVILRIGLRCPEPCCGQASEDSDQRFRRDHG